MTTDAVTTGGGQIISSEVKFTGNVARVTSTIVAANPVAGTESSGVFTREDSVPALDKVSQPIGRGRLAHLRPGSEEFARRKQEEIDHEEIKRNKGGEK